MAKAEGSHRPVGFSLLISVAIVGRFTRVVAVDVAHHVTQCGTGRRFILDCDADRIVYLKLMRENMALHGVTLVGYCLMSNHVHLIAIPGKPDGLAQAMKQINGRYACYWNISHQANGHVWQGRFYSCPLDEPHLWEALRYTELNPKRARMVAEPEHWPWSSAASHCGAGIDDKAVDLGKWRDYWTPESWRKYLQAGEDESKLAAIRQRTHTGRPLGSGEFIQGLEKATQRRLTLKKRGPREKIVTDRRQGALSFEP